MSGITMHYQQAAQIEKLSNEVRELKQRLIDLETAMAKLTSGAELSVSQERAVDNFRAKYNTPNRMIKITPLEQLNRELSKHLTTDDVVLLGDLMHQQRKRRNS